MIKIENKQDCCGCSACIQRCPKQCISLKEDAEGFLYPLVNESVCIDCGLCEKVCPLLNHPAKIPPSTVLAAKNRNEEDRMASSSGGMFIALAKKTIENGGVVFGAIFDDNWEVKHSYAESLEGVRAMMGSKYLQSRIGDSYRKAEQFLKEGRKVLFTGSPCQITGLHTFLHNDYPNLTTVDFLCHGVPSPSVWRKYISEILHTLQPKYGVKDKAINSTMQAHAITRIDFRDKMLNGWKRYSFVIHAKSNPKENSILLFHSHQDNPFMSGFLANIYLRPSCYHCKCKNGVSHSDLTIADFWGINVLIPDFDDDKGVSLLLINTPKGKDFLRQLENLEMRECHPSILAKAALFNGGFNEDINMHPKRALFYKYLSHGNSVTVAVNRALYTPLYRRIPSMIKHRIKKLLA